MGVAGSVGTQEARRGIGGMRGHWGLLGGVGAIRGIRGVKGMSGVYWQGVLVLSGQKGHRWYKGALRGVRGH